jgi:hypothetical protein
MGEILADVILGGGGVKRGRGKVIKYYGKRCKTKGTGGVNDGRGDKYIYTYIFKYNFLGGGDCCDFI